MRVLATSINYGAFLIRDGVSTRDDIDKMARLGLGYPRDSLSTLMNLG
jgi:enoyl-CoA hydratase/3-hydroxyacyl-CoA dehydrogenase